MMKLLKDSCRDLRWTAYATFNWKKKSPARFEPATFSMIFPPLIRLKLGSVPRPPTPPTAHRIRGVWGCLVERETHFASAFCCPLLDPVGSRRRIMILISLCVFIWNTLLLATQKHIKSFFFLVLFLHHFVGMFCVNSGFRAGMFILALWVLNRGAAPERRGFNGGSGAMKTNFQLQENP